MKELNVSQVIEAVEELCIQANCVLSPDMVTALQQARRSEESPLGQEVLDILLTNAELARKEQMPICQDTGMVVLFVEVGQALRLVGGTLSEALQEGVRRGYQRGYLRKSVVADPFQRVNTGDNTPAVIHYDLVPGEELTIHFAPKGFGSENMGALKMFKPSDGLEAVLDFVTDTVDRAGSNPCPPIIVGVGVGGTMEKAAYLAKKALLREVGSLHPDSRYAHLEQALLQRINDLGIGPQGFGGRNTALAVHMEVFPTHIAGLPAAVNINCHAARHRTIVLQGRETSGC